MRLGSTRGTNAILERKGAKTTFLVTRGFKDLLLIGTQQRKDLFALHVVKNKPLYEDVLEVNERMEADGTVLAELGEKEIDRIMERLKRKKTESVAIAFMNSYKNPAHENILKKRLRGAGFEFISASNELSAQIKILQRSETTVANAYLAPIIHSYINNIQNSLSGHPLKIMTSAGNLSNVSSFFPKDSLLSGPAGGVVGAAAIGAQSGEDQLITFDMGGTSTDVSLYNKRFDYRFESEVGELKILSPSLAIDTIAAGGGSVCDFDGFKLTVGPSSAGAFPGPACYGAGGPLTLTDVNLLLGRLDSQNFSIPLHPEAAEKALMHLLEKMRNKTSKKHNPINTLESLIQIANEKMMEAIRKVSIKSGHNPTEYTLLCFGGAGGQHACQLASMLDMSKVLIPYDAGLLSAYGIGNAIIERFEEQLILKPLDLIEPDLIKIIDRLFIKAKAVLVRESDDRIMINKQFLFLRFSGQESTLEIEFDPDTDIRQAFRKKYKAVFGHWLPDRVIEVESIRIVAGVVANSIKRKAVAFKKYNPPVLRESHYFALGSKRKIKIYRWEELDAGATIKGPAMVISDNSTSLIDKGWSFALDQNNNALLTRKGKLKVEGSVHAREAQIELFTNRFTSIAQEMGALLQRTSFSVNVKERLDFSCALLDAKGYLVVNAPHIPVHLGSLGVCVREVMKVIALEKGDVVITNHPGFGGSHLPDITLIKPVFYAGKRIGYAANRAHHAEIGGKTPGSMPADASQLSEEGVIISPTYLVRRGKPRWESIRKIFTGADFPTRLLEENLADLNGALAAVNFGEQSLISLCKKYGVTTVKRSMSLLRTHAIQVLTQKINKLPSNQFTATEYLDDGARIHVNIQIEKSSMKFDFSGSSPVHKGNLNATEAIVHSVILYVLRLLVDKPIPMNEGLMEPLEIILPKGMLNPDFEETKLPAVVGGNTEISQRLTDTLLKAFGLAACSQGTMNNFLFGNKSFGYYETICGGTGAGPGFDGADAVHQHMTNTRITDPEILEHRYPVRLEKFEIRKGSGGKGKWKGGNGVLRKIYFKSAVEVSLLAQHRIEKPFGLKGGEPGKCGAQFVVTAKGKVIKLKGQDGKKLWEGDRVVIKTPGGGGYGQPSK
jgi:5-oxoprolinase (ATP-hydrolysing)